MSRPIPQRVLITDFDGTLTRHDFYQIVRERLLPADCPDYWTQYEQGRLTHFQALRDIFGAAEGGEAALAAAVRDMGLEPDLKDAVARLGAHGWHIVIVSAGCLWYIDRLLGDAGVSLERHANLGRLEGGRLVMELPERSPFLCREVGIDKAAVVRSALDQGATVAFAGDGAPDLPPALLVRPALRFARGWLAEELTRRGEPFRPFGRWRDVANALVEGFAGGRA